MGLSSLFRNRFSRAARALSFSRHHRRARAAAAALRAEALERRSMLAAVSLVTSPNANGAYNAGDQVIIQVEFARPVTITSGNPLLRLNTGNYATFAGQSGAGATLNFRYDVQGPVAGVGGDNAADLDVFDSSALVNATFTDADGAFVPVLPVGTSGGVTNSLAFIKDIVIDTTPPAVPIVNELRVNPNIEQTNPGYAQVHPDYFTLTGTAGSGPLAAGETLTVSVNGCTYVLTPGSEGAPNASGNWRVDLLQPPTSGGPLMPWSTTSIQQYQAEAVFTDAAGNSSVGRGFVVIDMVGPSVQNVTATNPNGAYKAGDIIDVEVLFLEPVAVVGAPQLALGLDLVGTGPNAGAAGRVWADYSAAKSSGNKVVFSYTIQAGDTDADLEYEIVANGTAITLNGGMIQDGAGNPANLAMPLPGGTPPSTGTLGFNSDIVIDTTAPLAPTIGSVEDDVDPTKGKVDSPTGVTNDNALLIKGTAEANSTVKIYNGAMLLGTGTLVGTDWTFQTPTLADGIYNFVATATDAAGNVSVATTPAYTVTVDTTPPAAPVITAVEDDNPTPATIVLSGKTSNDTVLVLRGTAEVGSTVDIYDGTTKLNTVSNPVTLVGNAWTFTTAALTNGVTYAFNAVATDKAGNTGSASTAYTVTIDTTAPLPPIILGVTDDVAPLTGPVASGGRTNDTQPTISGTAEANATVTIRANGNVLGTATANGSGAWTYAVPTALSEGIQVFTALATDAAGNESAASGSYTVTIDTTAPNPPAITGVDDDRDASGNQVTATNVPNSGRTNDTVLVIKGTVAAADGVAQVEVFDGVTSLGLATLNGTTWTFTTGTLADGTTYSFTARATDGAGNQSGASAPPYVVTVDTTAPAAPVITGFADDAGTITGNVATGGISNDTTPILSGTMEAGTTDVKIRDGATELSGTLLLTSATTWAFAPAGPLADGLRVFTAVAVDGAGNKSGFSLAYNVTIDTVGLVPSITGVEDNVGPITGNVANGGSTNDTVLVITGTAEAGSTVELYNDIGNSPVLLGSPTLTGTAWTFTTGTLAEGTYNFRARITDAAGNVSSLSPAYTVTVDLTAPSRPIITAIVSDVPLYTGIVPNGGVTNDTSLLIQGTAEAGATVSVFNGATLLGTTTAAGNGSWAFTTGVLAPGSYSFRTTATDAAGNVSSESLPAYDVIVDTVAPGIPTIATVASDAGTIPPGGATNDATPSLTGATDSGTRVHVFNGAVELGEAVVAGTAWNFAFTSPLASGTYDFRVRSTDTAGNTTFSTVYAVTIDAVAPVPPTITGVDDDITPITRTLSSGLTTNDTVLVIRGTAEPLSTVRVYDGTTLLGTATLVGTAWTFTTGTLSNGTTYRFNATATDAVGNTSAPSSPDFAVTIDTTAPATPAITGVVDDVPLITGTISNPGVTNDTQLDITGTAEAGATVSVFNGLTQLGSTTAGTDGRWTFTTGVLASGIYNFRARATDAAGNESAASSAPDYVVTVDAIAPDVPAITDITDDVSPGTGPVLDNGFTNDTRLLLNGTAPSDAVRVDVYNGSSLLASVVPVSGAWSYEASGLVNGATYVFNARAIDAAGNTSSASPAHTVTIDIVAPSTPAITSVTDDTVPVVGTVANGGFTNDTSLQLAGTADAGTTVHVYNGSTLLGTATLVGSAWTYAATGLLDGTTYSFRVIATDAAGNSSTASTPWAVTVDTTAPNPPTLSASVTGSIVTLSGTTELNSTVQVYRDGVLLGDATVVGTDFRIVLPSLADGSYTFTATSTDRAGNVSLSSLPVGAVVDTVAPTAPAIAGVADDVAPGIGNVLSGAATNDSRPFVTGTMQSGTTRVQLYDNNVLVGEAILTSATTWTFQFTAELTDGVHNLFAVASDAAGNVSSPSVTYTLTVDTATPTAPSITGVADDFAPVIGSVMNGGTTNDSRVFLVGSMQSGTTRVAIFDNGSLVGDASLTSATSWSYQFVSALADGVHSLTARAYDAAGNESTISTAFAVTIDTAAPAAPTITQVLDDVGTFQGNVPNGGRTDDTLPTISGTAEANATVTIRANGNVLGTATANGSGAWIYAVPTALLNGMTYAFTAEATDAAGNTGAASAGYTVTIDTAAPAAPTITQVLDDVGTVQGNVPNGGRTDDTLPTISGTAEANATVTIRANGDVLGTATANGSGAWTYAVSTPLSEGIQVITAEATDAAGNTGTASAGYTVTIDTTAPVTPPAISGIVDNVGSITGPLVNGATTDDTVLTMSGTAPDGVALVLIYDNGLKIGEAVPVGGVWSFTTPTLPDATHDFSVRGTDAAGNESTASAAWTVVVDATPPAAPVIDQAVDNVGSLQGKVAHTASTDDTTPLITGTMEDGATRVAVFRNGTFVGNATLTSASTWSFQSASLTSGTYTFTARAYDLAGNQSAASSPPYTVTIAGPITASSPTFPASPLRSVSTPITSFTVVFSQPVTGFAVRNLRLFLGTRSVAITGATVTRAAGSDGSVWVVSLPRASVNLRGTYRLDITGTNIVSTRTGAAMTNVSSLSWRRI